MIARLCSKICRTIPEPYEGEVTEVPARRTMMKMSFVSTSKTKVTVSDTSTNEIFSKKESMAFLASPAVVAKPLVKQPRKRSISHHKQQKKLILASQAVPKAGMNLLMDTDFENLETPNLELLRQESKLYQDDYTSNVSPYLSRFHQSSNRTSTGAAVAAVYRVWSRSCSRRSLLRKPQNEGIFP